MSEVQGDAGSGLHAAQKLAAGNVGNAAVARGSAETKARTDAGETPEIDPNAEPFVRLVLDSASVVGLEALIGLKVAEPIGAGQIGEFLRVLAQHVERRARASQYERPELVVARRKIKHKIHGGLESMDWERRLEDGSIRWIGQEVILVPRVGVEAFLDTRVIPEIFRDSAAEDSGIGNLVAQASPASRVVGITRVEV